MGKSNIYAFLPSCRCLQPAGLHPEQGSQPQEEGVRPTKTAPLTQHLLCASCTPSPTLMQPWEMGDHAAFPSTHTQDILPEPSTDWVLGCMGNKADSQTGLPVPGDLPILAGRGWFPDIWPGRAQG